jgi:hypothetical protein
MSDSRSKHRAERIKKELRIAQVLFDLGYPIRPDAGDREEQFPCDLHGDGRDGKPSARVYPESDSWYCFGCNRTRDAIETVKEKKGLGFVAVLDWLEKKYNLPPLPWEDDEGYERKQSVKDEVFDRLNQSGTFDSDRKSLESLLDGLTKDRLLPLEVILNFWEAFDKLTWFVSEKRVSETVGRATLVGLRNRILEVLKENRGT